MKPSKANTQKFVLVIVPVIAVAMFANFPSATISAAKSIVGFAMPGIFDAKPKKDFGAYAEARCEIEVPPSDRKWQHTMAMTECIGDLYAKKRAELDATKKLRRLEEVEAMPH